MQNAVEATRGGGPAMSILTTAPDHHHPARYVRVPVVLPLVEFGIDAAGKVSVSVDHEPYEVPDQWAGLGRGALGRVVEQITGELGSPV